MKNNDINSAWAAVAPILKKYNYHDIKAMAGLAGFDMKVLDDLGFDDFRQQNTSTDQLVSEMGSYFLSHDNEIKSRFLHIFIEEILSGNHKLQSNFSDEQRGFKEKIEYYLERLGWQLIGNKVLPIEILDLADLNELNPVARKDLLKAATKFRDGDLSGAISSACAAVDSVTERVYQDKGLGDGNNSKSFQERCNKSLDAIGVFTAIDQQLSEIQWKDSDITHFKTNLKQSLNQASYVMQTLRSGMSDVHGTKPVIKPLVFDSIKWAQIIIRLLSQKYDG